MWPPISHIKDSDPTENLISIGKYLEELPKIIEDKELMLPNRVYQRQESYGFKLHTAWHYNPAKITALIIKLKTGIPKSYDILKCDPSTSRFDLQKFFGRAKILQKSCRPSFVLEPNKLTYNMQEVSHLIFILLFILILKT